MSRNSVCPLFPAIHIELATTNNYNHEKQTTEQNKLIFLIEMRVFIIFRSVFVCSLASAHTMLNGKKIREFHSATV